MSIPRHLLFLVSFLLYPCFLQAASSSSRAAEPPVIGRREPFWGAVGSRKFEVIMRAQPTELQVGEALMLTIRIATDGTWQHRPERPDLAHHRAYTEFARNFLIDNLAESYSDTHTWEFMYRLRPRSEAVQRIPPLSFVYFRPGLIPESRGYMTTEAPEIPLKVRPRAEVPSSDVEGRTTPPVPERFYRITEGNSVLAREDPFALPPWWLLTLFLIGPPVGCAGWYLVWNRLYPDAARLARLGRSRAAKQALRALHTVAKDTTQQQARNAAEIMATYLQQRLDCQTVQPAPVEAAVILEEAGCSSALAERLAAFLQGCDDAQFSPGGLPDQKQLLPDAIHLMHALEAELCLSRTS